MKLVEWGEHSLNPFTQVYVSNAKNVVPSMRPRICLNPFTQVYVSNGVHRVP